MLSLMAAAHWLRQVSFHRWVGILQGPSLGVVLFRGCRTSPVVPTATSASDYLRYVYVQKYRLCIWPSLRLCRQSHQLLTLVSNQLESQIEVVD